MADLYTILQPENSYYDRKNYSSLEQYTNALQTSTTVYVGNLSFVTTQDSIRQLFSLAGRVSNIIMGIDNEGHACGFCFVVFETREEARNAVEFISKTKLNERTIRVDWDPGYKEDREKGRGTGGQQRRQDFRSKQDAERPRRKPAYERQRQDRYDRPRQDRGDRMERERTRERHDYDRSQKRRDREREGADNRPRREKNEEGDDY